MADDGGSDHDLLIKIVAQNDAILHRLDKGDERMRQIEEDAESHDKRLHSLERDRSAVKAIVGALTALGGAVLAFMTWVSLTFPNFVHSGK